MKKLLLNHLYVPEWFEKHECQHCGRSGRRVRLYFPQIERVNDFVRLVYSADCECGKRSPFKVEMPILLLGLAFVRLLLTETRSRRHHGALDIVPTTANVSECLIRDFTRIISEFAEQALGFPPGPTTSPDDTVARWDGLTDVDRIKFGMGVQEWKEFKRRLGLDEDEAGGNDVAGAAE